MSSTDQIHGDAGAVVSPDAAPDPNLARFESWRSFAFSFLAVLAVLETGYKIGKAYAEQAE